MSHKRDREKIREIQSFVEAQRKAAEESLEAERKAARALAEGV